MSLNCSDSTRDNIVEKPLVLTSETFDVVGKTHNQALDYIYESVFVKSKTIKYEDVNEASIDFIFNVNEDTKNTKDNPNLLRTSEQKNYIQEIVENPENKTFNQLLEKNNLSVNQKRYIALFETEVKNKNIAFTQKIENIKRIEKNAISELRDNEIVYILCITSVAKNSIEYWNTTGKKWFKNYNEKSTLSKGGIDWEAVAVADILAFEGGFPAGVTTGMVAGGLALGVSTAGIGAVLGGLVGGTATGLAAAAGSSASMAIAYQVKSFFMG